MKGLVAMTEQELQEMLADMIFERKEADDEYELEASFGSVVSFEEAGVMTMNKGLVVRMRDGSEFQLTIVQSR